MRAPSGACSVTCPDWRVSRRSVGVAAPRGSSSVTRLLPDDRPRLYLVADGMGQRSSADCRQPVHQGHYGQQCNDLQDCPERRGALRVRRRCHGSNSAVVGWGVPGRCAVRARIWLGNHSSDRATGAGEPSVSALLCHRAHPASRGPCRTIGRGCTRQGAGGGGGRRYAGGCGAARFLTRDDPEAGRQPLEPRPSCYGLVAASAKARAILSTSSAE